MLEIICQRAPDRSDRANEDAFITYQRDDGQPRYVLAAIDGATSVADFAPLKHYLDTRRNGISPAALAATTARDAILAALGSDASNDDVDPGSLILAANAALRDLLAQVAPGIYDVQEILAVHPECAHLLDDPRKIRLFLPAAVLTLATIDTDVQMLRFGHAGDTALLVCHDDGRVAVPTRDENITMDYESALVAASNVVLKRGYTMRDALNDPVIRALDRDHRIHHNYVDENGQTVDGQGIGVVDGLSELADYICTGMVMLEDVAAVMVVSDGFQWPAPLHETPAARQMRLERMWARIQSDGVRGYLAALRAEERADFNRDQYPRFKLHDDATAVVLWLS